MRIRALQRGGKKKTRVCSTKHPGTPESQEALESITTSNRPPHRNDTGGFGIDFSRPGVNLALEPSLAPDLASFPLQPGISHTQQPLSQASSWGRRPPPQASTCSLERSEEEGPVPAPCRMLPTSCTPIDWIRHLHRRWWLASDATWGGSLARAGLCPGPYVSVLSFVSFFRFRLGSSWQAWFVPYIHVPRRRSMIASPPLPLGGRQFLRWS